MRLPIDTAQMTFIAASLPRPVLDQQQQPRLDKATGTPLYALRLTCMTDEDTELLMVKTVGAPSGQIRNGIPVAVLGLTAQPYQLKDGTKGVAYRADRIEAAAAPTSKAS
jgi:hypothetical protein